MTEKTQKVLSTTLRNLLITGAYSDLTITCGTDIYNVHKVIVCSRSDVICKTVGFGGTETESGNIDLPEDDPELVKLMLQYCYFAEYEPFMLPDPHAALLHNDDDDEGVKYGYDFPHTCNRNKLGCRSTNVCPHHFCYKATCEYRCSDFICEECELAVSPSNPAAAFSAEQLMLHVEMALLADKFDIEGLHDLATAKYRRACERFWDTPEFEETAEFVVGNGDGRLDTLRSVVVKILVDHKELIGKEKIEELLKSREGFAYEVLKRRRDLGWK